jgi:hypothetical protein
METNRTQRFHFGLGVFRIGKLELLFPLRISRCAGNAPVAHKIGVRFAVEGLQNQRLG